MRHFLISYWYIDKKQNTGTGLIGIRTEKDYPSLNRIKQEAGDFINVIPTNIIELAEQDYKSFWEIVK